MLCIIDVLVLYSLRSAIQKGWHIGQMARYPERFNQGRQEIGNWDALQSREEYGDGFSLMAQPPLYIIDDASLKQKG